MSETSDQSMKHPCVVSVDLPGAFLDETAHGLDDGIGERRRHELVTRIDGALPAFIELHGQRIGLAQDFAHKTSFALSIDGCVEFFLDLAVAGLREIEIRPSRNDDAGVCERCLLMLVVFPILVHGDVVGGDALGSAPLGDRARRRMPSAFIRVDADIQHGLAHVMREPGKRTGQNPARLVHVGVFRLGLVVENLVLGGLCGKDGCFERMPEKPPEAAMMMVGGCRQQMHEACKVPDDRHQVALDFIVR